MRVLPCSPAPIRATLMVSLPSAAWRLPNTAGPKASIAPAPAADLRKSRRSHCRCTPFAFLVRSFPGVGRAKLAETTHYVPDTRSRSSLTGTGRRVTRCCRSEHAIAQTDRVLQPIARWQEHPAGGGCMTILVRTSWPGRDHRRKRGHSTFPLPRGKSRMSPFPLPRTALAPVPPGRSQEQSCAQIELAS